MSVHAPKLETFDVPAATNTDPKGVVRQVEEYRVTPFGLYLARPAPGRRDFHYLESWLLPGLGLRITDFWFEAGYERDQDFYVDVVDIDAGTGHDGGVWRTTDLYLDLVLRDGHGVSVLDSDELLAAVAEGFLPRERACGALETAYATVDGLARHGYELAAWLSTVDIELTWRRHPPIG